MEWIQLCGKSIRTIHKVKMKEKGMGVSKTIVDNEPVIGWTYVGWLSYLFLEKNHIKNLDPWRIFEEMHYISIEYDECLLLNITISDAPAFAVKVIAGKI